GDKRLVVNDDLIGVNGSASLSIFNDDLRYRNSGALDIIKVYKYKQCINLNELLKDDNLDLIWERKDIELTDREIEVLKGLKVLGFKFLARDLSSYLYGFCEKPYKTKEAWLLDLDDETDEQYVGVSSVLFDFIKWDDVEPKSI